MNEPVAAPKKGQMFRVAARADIDPSLHNAVVEIIGWLKREHTYSCRVCSTGAKVKVYANDLK